MNQARIDYSDIHNGSPGSKRAAEAIKPKRVSQRDVILGFIRRAGAGGATRDEIAWHLGYRLASVCARVSELTGHPHLAGLPHLPALIKAAPFTRANSSGIQVEVLVAI